MHRHGRTIHVRAPASRARDRISAPALDEGLVLVVLLAAAAALLVCRSAVRPARRSPCWSTGGTVVTMNAARRVIADGAVAIESDTIVAVGPTAATRAQYRGGAIGSTRGPGDPAGPDQHAHARADGALPRTRRRSRADGLAPTIHLPGRGEDGVAGFRAHRHAPRRARDDRVGNDDVRRHVLLRGRHRGGRRTTPDCAACSGSRSSSSPWPTPTRRRRRWPAPRRSSRSGRTTRW